MGLEMLSAPFVPEWVLSSFPRVCSIVLSPVLFEFFAPLVRSILCASQAFTMLVRSSLGFSLSHLSQPFCKARAYRFCALGPLRVLGLHSVGSSPRWVA